MLKQIIALAFVISVAGATYHLQSGDTREHCEDVCYDQCKNCTEPYRCSEHGKKCCGSKDRDPEHPICIPDEICVPLNCECDYQTETGKICKGTCTPECTITDTVCGQPIDKDGCKQCDICVPTNPNPAGEYTCPGFCPIECSELKCPKNDENGCPVQPECKPFITDNTGNKCPIQKCDCECDEPNSHICQKPADGHDCPGEEFCQPCGTSETGNPCQCTCPVECQNWQINCKGQKIYEDTIYKTCTGQDICKEKAQNNQGTYCPDDSSSHNCPKTCPTHQCKCDGCETSTGCYTADTCVDKSIGHFNSYCSCVSVCPKCCPPSQYPCSTGFDENGCKKAEECIPKCKDDNGGECPEHCTPICNEQTQVLCKGKIDWSGCKQADTCVNIEDHVWGPGSTAEDPNCIEKCPGVCPKQCATNEILCPKQADPCNGCPTEEVCRIAIKGTDGVFCPGKERPNLENYDVNDETQRCGGFISASHNCPKLCRENEGEVLCPGLDCTDNPGCKRASVCRNRNKGTDGYPCSVDSICPRQCPKNYILCEYQNYYDENGCPLPAICIKREPNKYGLLCPGYCPPVCAEDETIFQKNERDSNGCLQASYCEKINAV